MLQLQEERSLCKGLTKQEKKKEHQTVVPSSAMDEANGAIKGPIAGNWKDSPIRGQYICCPPKMAKENTQNICD